MDESGVELAELGGRRLGADFQPDEKTMIQKKAVKKTTRKGPAKRPSAPKAESPSKLIDARIRELNDWRGETLSRMRALIRKADPKVVEEWKWDVPVWSHDGLICTGEVYKYVVKLTFAKGARLKDPQRLFNSSLGGNTRRAIDIPKDAELDEGAFKTLIREAVILNTSSSRSKR